MIVERDVDSLERLLRPRSVALVGASSDPQKTAGRPLRYLRKHGFTGSLYLVNPRAAEIDGVACVPSVEALPEVPDVAMVLLGPDRVEEAVRRLARRGVAAAIVLAGGFAETGPDGERRQRALREAAGPMRVLGPNTIGLVNVSDRTAISASIALEIERLNSGSIGVVSQSGGMLGSLLSRGVGRGIGFSKLVATGNEVDLEVADFVEFLIEDYATTVIALYLEGLRNPGRFRDLARRAAARGKPIVAYKVGRSEPGARSAASHTGAMAGADRVYEAFFEQSGVIRVATFTDLLDVSAALASERRLGGRRLAILTSTGGAGALLADACGAAGFETPPPDGPTAARLGACLIGEGAVPDRNPIDLTLTGLRPEIFRAAISALLESPTYDAAVVVVGSSGIGQPDLVAGSVVDLRDRSDKPVVVYVSPHAPNIVAALNNQSVPAFDTPEGCAAALAAMVRVGEPRLTSPRGAVLRRVDVGDLPRGRLNESESKRLFGRVGIPVVREVVAASPDEAAAVAPLLGDRVVLKVLSRDILHKTEAGGVMLDVPAGAVADAASQLLRAVERTRPDARVEGLLVQERIVDGVEMVLGYIRDPQLGPVVLLGAGGVATEVFDDTALRLAPLDEVEAREMVGRLKAAALLAGFRGRPPADVDALVAAVVAFSDLVVALGERLVEAEINPLLVLPNGGGVRAADGLVVVR